jgi:acid ceramidase
MEQLGQANVGFPGLFNVLSGKPNLNMLTTYTALMHTATGEMQSFTQDCEVPCPPW